ncbi:MAG: hypothetical protein M0D55_16215 [Elusimicrobiota bacterium]|nr:MAG: hypothetical protein M0D55_16215 [Elusimicrobiota bacterium]
MVQRKAAWTGDRAFWAVFAGVLLLNLSTRSLFYNFDGVACAIAVELSDFKHLVHGNHLGYGVVAWAFDKLWRLFGYQGQAILTLQALDSILGAFGAAFFADLLRRQGRGEREAVLGAAALAVAHAWWFWSLEAQVYMLGALFIVLGAREALSDHPKPFWLGLWHALAVLGHVGHLMAFPAFAYLLLRKKGIREYALTMASVVAAAYVMAGVFAVKPANLQELRLWLLGSAALGVDRGFNWHSTPLGYSLWAWSRMTFRIFTEFVGRTGVAWSLGVVLAAVPVLAALRGAAEKTRESLFWLIWLAGYALLFIAWEPYTIVYRVTDLIALVALATMGLQGFSAKARTALLAAWVLAAGAYNYATVVLPSSRFENNPDLVEAEWTKISTPPDGWVLVNGRGGVYVPYFAGRRTVNLRYFDAPGSLETRLDLIAATGDALFVTGRTLEQEGLLARLRTYGLKPHTAAPALETFRVARAK